MLHVKHQQTTTQHGMGWRAPKRSRRNWWVFTASKKWHIADKRAPIQRPIRTRKTVSDGLFIAEDETRTRSGRRVDRGRPAVLTVMPQTAVCRSCVRGLRTLTQ